MDTRLGTRANGLPELLDDKTRMLVRLGALIASGASADCCRRRVADAKAAGASDDEVVGVLIAIAPTVGMAGLVASTVSLALALGYNIDEALEIPPGSITALTRSRS